MHIKSISTYNFRNLEDQTVNLSPGVNFVLGKNGQGKTNLIESISLLSRGKSFRTSKPREIIKSDKSESSVFATIVNQEQEFNLGIAFKEEGRDYFFNQDKINSLKDYLGKLLSISFSPNDLELIKGSPQERRGFLDKHISDIKPSYIDYLMEYQRALKNKNQILKNSHDVKKDDVIPWNVILSRAGAVVRKERNSLIKELLPRVNHFYKVFSNDDSEIGIFISNRELGQENLEPENYLSKLNNCIGREISQRTSAVGVHRDEIEIFLKGNSSKVFASQGETRSLVLSLKIAVLEVIENTLGIRPLLLLDDVDSELDISRRKALLDIAFEKNRQIVITGTQLPTFDTERLKNYQIFEVSGGRIDKKTSSQSFTSET